MANDNVSHLPEPGVILDLDTAERPKEDVKAPFVVKIGGRQVTFKDPAEIDWQDLAAASAPGDLIRVSLSREDRVHLSEVNMPTWKFTKLMDAYYTHYDLEDKIRAAKRQAALNG